MANIFSRQTTGATQGHLSQTLPRRCLVVSQNLRAPSRSGRKASFPRVNSGYNFIPWRSAGPDKYESAFKEAIKAGSTALAVTRHRLSQSNVNQPRIIAAGGKPSLAGDLLSRGLCRAWRLDVLRRQYRGRALQARRSRWSTRFSKAPSPPTFPSSNHPSSSS